MYVNLKRKNGLLLILLCFCFAYGCHEDHETPRFKTRSAIATDAMVKIIWLTTSEDYTSAEISISPVSDLSLSSQTKTVEGSIKRSIEFYRLNGLTEYRYVISLLRGNVIQATTRGDFRTSYSMLEKEIITRDDYHLYGKLFFLYSWNQKAPAIVMMHDLGEGVFHYQGSPYIESWVEKGYACMIFSFRGHNRSDPFPRDSLKGPKSAFYIGCDIEAVIKTIKYDRHIDPKNIGLLGGGLGGNGAVIGNYFPEVKTSVVLGTMTGQDQMNIKDFFPELQTFQKQSIYYISGELDTTETYNMPNRMNELYNATEDPKKIWIISNRTVHFSAMAENYLVADSVMLWFLQQMPSPNSR